MLRSHLRLALRSLRRRFGYTTINALGLTVGLACCAVIAVFLQHERSWDAHHDAADRIYRILSNYGDSEYTHIRFEGFQDDTDDAEEQRSLARALRDLPAVEQAANYTILDSEQFVERTDGDRLTSDRRLITTTGAAFVDLFAFERLAGDSLRTALSSPGTALLPASTAETYFGDANPIGKTITVGESAFTVTAVVADPPSNSRLQFDIALHVKRSPSWAAQHYMRLAKGIDPAAISPQISQVMDKVDPSRRDDPNLKSDRLQAMADVYLGPRKKFDRGPHRDAAYLWIFAAIGALILVVTTINYANLALAMHAERHGEIGVRKALGGYPKQIAKQFLVESLLLVMMCIPLALMLASAVLPAFNELMDTTIGARRMLQPAVLLAMIGLGVGAGLVAGSYPAFILARKQTIELFGRAFSASGGRGWTLRHGLIALQFVVLIGLGSLSWTAYDQLRYMQTDALPYETENVVRLPGTSTDTDAYATWRERLTQSPAVAAVGMGPQPRPRIPTSTFALSGDRDKVYNGQVRTVDMHWFDVVGIKHPVVEEMQSQASGAEQRALINETAERQLRDKNPMGQSWIIAPGNRDYETPVVEGVLPDLYFHSVRQEIAPTLYRVHRQPPWAGSILVRFADGQRQAGMDHLAAVWSELRPDRPLQASYMNALVGDLYEQERRFTTLSGVLAGLAILLAGLGLASLVAYMTRLRLKEIGIRKALGGSVASIIAHLNREYAQIAGIAFLVGAPLAWYLASEWLGQFALRIELSPWVFAASGLLAAIVAVVAVSLQAGRAAKVNPADVLRAE